MEIIHPAPSESLERRATSGRVQWDANNVCDGRLGPKNSCTFDGGWRRRWLEAAAKLEGSRKACRPEITRVEQMTKSFSLVEQKLLLGKGLNSQGYVMDLIKVIILFLGPLTRRQMLLNFGYRYRNILFCDFLKVQNKGAVGDDQLCRKGCQVPSTTVPFRIKVP